MPFARRRASVEDDSGDLGVIVLDVRLNAGQRPGPLHRVPAGDQLGGPDNLVGRVAHLDFGDRRPLRHVDGTHQRRDEAQFANRRSRRKGEALLGQGAARRGMQQRLLGQVVDALVARQAAVDRGIKDVAHVPQVEQTVVGVQHAAEVVAVPDELQRAVAVGFLHAERRQSIGGDLVQDGRRENAIRCRVLGRQRLDGPDGR